MIVLKDTMIENHYNSIAFLDDIIRSEFWESKEFVYGLISEPIKQGTGFSITGSPRSRSHDWMQLGFDKSAFLTVIERLGGNWVDFYNGIPQEAACLLIAALRRETVYIGYEMPLWLTKTLSEHDCTYIDIRLSPIRFCRDLYFAVSSNCKDIQRNLLSFEVPSDFFRIEASQIRASIAHLNGRSSNLEYEDSLIFVGQTKTDTSLLSPESNEVLRPASFAEKLREVRKKFKNFYYLAHPYSWGRAEDEIQELNKILNEEIYKCNIPSYEILSDDSKIGLVSISSGLLQEAKCFGKEIFYLHKPVCLIEGPDRHINVQLDDISDPLFWSILLKNSGPLATSYKQFRNVAPNQLRLLHNAWWGYGELMLKDRSHYKDIVNYGGAVTRDELGSLRRQAHMDLDGLRHQTHLELDSLHSYSKGIANVVSDYQNKHHELLDHFQRLENDLRHVMMKYTAAQDLNAQQASDISQIVNSTSWRVTRPLRWLKLLLSKFNRSSR
ncbi:hypothetical protein [Ochrobactrum quorumnocens]|uniref:Uncharacterized protein n=1 Tax=Ochrobactrum quorumnocens TaxID=271865 RepID=A0A5N1K3M1_9HYPH|nr:hypothetical protein [[Ochrobactrum] quorumnocens]KAA9370916.1 hypothetical protein F3W84_00395 [[Ochrobactrum] quorumnocens]